MNERESGPIFSEMEPKTSIPPLGAPTVPIGLPTQCIGSLSSLYWFLVFTKPGGERIATTNLERQGYSVYHPRLIRPLLYRGRWRERVVSLFPRYLFVRMSSALQSLAPVGSTVGVATIVRFGAEAVVVPHSVIEGLISRADPESGLHRLGSAALKRGTRVNIVAGAFEGLEGIFEREVGEERSMILLRLLGQETPVRIPTRYIASAR